MPVLHTDAVMPPGWDETIPGGPVRPRVLLITGRADVGGGPEPVYQLLQSLHTDYERFVACRQEPPYWDRYTAVVGHERMLVSPRRALSPTMVSRVLAFIRSHRIHLVHSRGLAAGLVARPVSRIAGLRSIHTAHGMHFLWNPRARRLVQTTAERMLCRLADISIFVSKDELESARTAGLRPRGAIVIPNGITTPSGLHAPTPLAAGCPLRIVNANQFNDYKNPFGLIGIFEELRKRLPDDTLLQMLNVYGGGPNRAAFERSVKIQGLDVAIHVLGPRPGLSTRLPDYDLLLSCARWEGLPLTVLVAMGCGLPVLVSRVPGHGDLLRRAFPEISSFDLDNPSAAAEQLLGASRAKPGRQLALHDVETRRAISAHGRHLISCHYRRPEMIRAVSACYVRTFARRAEGVRA